MPDQPLAALGDRDHRRRGLVAAAVGDDDRRSALDDGHARVGRAEIDADDLLHASPGPLVWKPLLPKLAEQILDHLVQRVQRVRGLEGSTGVQHHPRGMKHHAEGLLGSRALGRHVHRALREGLGLGEIALRSEHARRRSNVRVDVARPAVADAGPAQRRVGPSLAPLLVRPLLRVGVRERSGQSKRDLFVIVDDLCAVWSQRDGEAERVRGAHEIAVLLESVRLLHVALREIDPAGERRRLLERAREPTQEVLAIPVLRSRRGRRVRRHAAPGRGRELPRHELAAHPKRRVARSARGLARTRVHDCRMRGNARLRRGRRHRLGRHRNDGRLALGLGRGRRGLGCGQLARGRRYRHRRGVVRRLERRVDRERLGARRGLDHGLEGSRRRLLCYVLGLAPATIEARLRGARARAQLDVVVVLVARTLLTEDVVRLGQPLEDGLHLRLERAERLPIPRVGVKDLGEPEVRRADRFLVRVRGDVEELVERELVEAIERVEDPPASIDIELDAFLLELRRVVEQEGGAGRGRLRVNDAASRREAEALGHALLRLTLSPLDGTETDELVDDRACAVRSEAGEIAEVLDAGQPVDARQHVALVGLERQLRQVRAGSNARDPGVVGFPHVRFRPVGAPRERYHAGSVAGIITERRRAFARAGPSGCAGGSRPRPRRAKPGRR